jgi:hypothetical protein
LSLPDFSSFMTYDRFKRLLRKIDFALKPTDGEAHGCFWKVQPLVDAFNENRQTGFQAGWKLVVDESMSAWKGHDQRHGAVGCPHVNLMAVSWNEGKKDKTTEKIVKKNIISTCGTTLAGQAHKKRRWQVHEDGTISKVTIDIKRPRVTEEYFTGAQAIDVHNHYRQGTLALEARRTNRWDWRFFQTFLGIVEVDAYVAYKRFCPGKQDVTHNQFLLSVIDYLLNNKIGVPDTAPVLRPRAARAQAEQAEAVVGMHDLQALETAAYFAEKKRGVLTCRVCKMKCYWYCATCSSDATCAKGLAALCGPGTGRDCFVTHQTQNPVSTAAGSSK